MDTRKFRNEPKAEHEPAAAAMGIDEARAILCGSLRMLDTINTMAHSVLVSTPREVAVAIFRDGASLPVEGLLPGKAAPRGRVHPLLALIRLALQSTRLTRQIALWLFPEVLNEEGPGFGKAAGDIEKLVKELGGMAKDLGIDPA